MALFEVKDESFISDFKRVEHTEAFINQFKKIYSEADQALYNHSPIFPFSYLNKGRMELYLHLNLPIPLVKKFKNAPKYWIHNPGLDMKPDELYQVVKQIELETKASVDITDLTSIQVDFYLDLFHRDGYKKIKTSTDVVQDAAKLSNLTGRNFSSLRNSLKHVEKDLKPDIQKLGSSNYLDAIKVFKQWKEESQTKYFRITIGRDVRLIEEYYDKLDFERFFGYVYYVNSLPSAVSFGCRSYYRDDWGQDITVKGLFNQAKGISDFAFIHLMQEMNKKGIIYVNDSGGEAKVKLNKYKFHPIDTIQMFDLRNQYI